MNQFQPPEDIKRCEYCSDESSAYITQAVDSSSVATYHLCAAHASQHFQLHHDRYSGNSYLGPGDSESIGTGTVFDFDFLLWDRLRDPPWGYQALSLIERGGRRRFTLQIDVCVARSIDFELQGFKSSRPLTYQMISSIVATLGGRLLHIEIDRVYPASGIYEAKLHIHCDRNTVLIDARPSDAIALAIMCKLPIVVSDGVLHVLTK